MNLEFTFDTAGITKIEGDGVELICMGGSGQVYDFIRECYNIFGTKHCDKNPSILVPQIKKVEFHDPATIVWWEDNTKTVVKCGEYDKFNPEFGLAMAISKKALGNKYNYYDVFQKWIPQEYWDEFERKKLIESLQKQLYSFNKKKEN